MPLRPKQHELLTNVRNRRDAGVKSQLAVAPVAFGKTVVFANMPTYLDLQGKMVVMAHTEELVGQAEAKLKHWNPGLTVEIEMGEREATSKADIIVASPQTLMAQNYKRRDHLLDHHVIDLQVCDEAHHYVTAEKWRGVVQGIQARYGKSLLVGVTATPNPTNGAAMGTLFDEITFNYAMLDAIRDGWLVPPRGYRLKTKVNISKVKTFGGDFAQGDLSRTVNTHDRNDLIVGQWLMLAPNRKTIAFCVDIQHSKDMADAFMRAGVPAQAIWGNDPDRAEKLRMHRSGQLRVLCSVNVLTEGYDDPTVSCVIMARPTRSQLVYTQILGRGLRLPEGVDNLVSARQAGVLLGKEDCILLDVCDVSEKLSLVTLVSLFGLPPKLNLEGASVLKAIETLEEEQKKKDQEIDFSKLEDLSKASVYLERADLFHEKLPEIVEQNSKLAWHQTIDGAYAIKMGKSGERVRIKKNLGGKWDVDGRVNGFDISEPHFPDLISAFNYADQSIFLQASKSLFESLRHENHWHNDAPTPTQLARLKKLGFTDFSDMTKKKAANLIFRSQFRKAGRQQNWGRPA